MKKNKLFIFTISIFISIVLTSCASLFGPPTVTFIVDNQVYSSYTLLEGETTALIPESPTKEGNQFLGWAFDKKGETVFNENTRVSLSHKVYGIWKYYDFEFEDKYGNVDVVKQELNTYINLPNNPTNSDYYFCGWMSSKTGNVIDNNTVIRDVDDNKYYAMWSNAKLERRSDGYWKVVGVKDGWDSKIIIPSYFEGKKVVEIGESCFKDNDSIISVIIPDTITKIGNFAFYDCDNLRSLNIPEGIKRLPNKMAYSCDRLTDVTLPSTLLYLGDELPTGRDYDIEDYAYDIFTGCSIERINLPRNLKVIGHGCLAETKIKELVLPSSLRTIEEYALRKNNNLTSIVIPANVTKIGKKVLDNCKNLKTITYASSANIPVAAFENDKNLEEITFTGQPRKISSYAFKNCDSLELVRIPYSVELLEKEAFSYCDKLKTAFILNNNNGFITRVEGDPFKGCKVNAYVYSNAIDDYKKISYWKKGMDRGWVRFMDAH